MLDYYREGRASRGSNLPIMIDDWEGGVAGARLANAEARKRLQDAITFPAPSTVATSAKRKAKKKRK